MEGSLQTPTAISFNEHQEVANMARKEQVHSMGDFSRKWLTGNSRLMTLKESRHALSCVTALL